MLEHVNYVVPDANLREIVIKILRKEWNYSFDVIIKVFYKISDFDAITVSMQHIGYSVPFEKYFSPLFINKLIFMLFIMIVINHFIETIQVEKESDMFNCWVKKKEYSRTW